LARLDLPGADYLKLDLEGAEYSLLESIHPASLRPFRQIFVEFHHHCLSSYGPVDTQRLVDRIIGFGWRAFSFDDHNYLFFRSGSESRDRTFSS
jgi:hypothetical protein